VLFGSGAAFGLLQQECPRGVGSGSRPTTSSTGRLSATRALTGCLPSCTSTFVIARAFVLFDFLISPRSYLRVSVLLMTIIPSPYWRLFFSYTIIFLYLVAELIIKPWRLRSVQVFSYVSYFLLMFAMSILFRPASEQLFKPFVNSIMWHLPTDIFHFIIYLILL
jgi:hypothetical protein